ncbi:MAG: hypothetical protein ACI9CD_000525 [Candidatus Deianiraeaceae bacterium]|jgi:hypothetical protein
MNADIKLFEFTTQEKNTIDAVFSELTEITCILIAEGMQTNNMPQINGFDIIHHVLENSQKGKGDAMRFAILGAHEINGMVHMKTNKGAISYDAVLFLEEMFNKQIEVYQRAIPMVLEVFHSKNLHLTGTTKEIKDC